MPNFHYFREKAILNKYTKDDLRACWCGQCAGLPAGRPEFKSSLRPEAH